MLIEPTELNPYWSIQTKDPRKIELLVLAAAGTGVLSGPVVQDLLERLPVSGWVQLQDQDGPLVKELISILPELQ